MMAGLAALKAYSYVYNSRHRDEPELVDELEDVFTAPWEENGPMPESARDGQLAAHRSPWRPPCRASPPPAIAPRPIDVFALLEKIEWDTLMFFYGVLMGVGALGALGYLALTSQFIYGVLGATTANVLVGLLSAVIDNVPVMFAVLQMSPEMSHGQWLLVTLTAGRWRIAAVHRQRSGCGAHGPGARNLHVWRPLALDLGNRAGLRGEHRHATLS